MENTMVKLELSTEMIAVIAAALGNHPYRQAAPVIAAIQRQFDAQTQSAKPSSNGIDKSEEGHATN